MRVVLLTAGRATRLQPLTDALPKCLLEIAGETIVGRAVRILAQHGIRRFTVVEGFLGDMVRARLRAAFPAEWFHFVRNDAYATTNNAYSLFLARDPCREPMLLCDGDVVFDPAVVARLLEDPRADRLAVRTRGGLGDEEMKVEIDGQGRIVAIGKDLAPARAAGEAVGLAVFSASLAGRLFAALERRLRRDGGSGEWYESSFLDLIREGAALHAVDLGAARCIEVDTLDDLTQARALFAGPLDLGGPGE